ncbi:MAG: hypothetical protein N2322_04335, partial [Terrimicrobiaceae bacterium]|nr:hypothetical protein [Terrimicrobiaceae bacterium]
ALALAGIAGGVLFAFWSSGSGLSSLKVLVYGVLAVTGLLVAAQTVFAGFTFGILQLVGERRLFPRKRRSDASPPPAG